MPKISKNAVDYKCPKCHAPLKFNPKEQNWTCEYCGSILTLEDLKANTKKYNEKKAFEEENINLDEEKADEKDVGEYNLYKCPDCGAQIVTDLNTSATFCVYCKNTAIIKERLTGKFEPKEIIPFQKTITDAKNAFKKVGKNHPLMPSSFNSERNISEIRGIYIPFWLFSGTSVGGIVTECRRVRHWHSGNYDYTKTDIYSVIKEGEVVFQKVPNDGAIKFDDAIMNTIEPFDYKKLVPFDPSYLSGFLAEKYDVSSEEAREQALRRMKNTTSDALKSDIKGYDTCIVKKDTIEFPNLDIEYVLLPVYLLNIKYNDEVYTFAMNGESGKLIGNMPVDKKKTVFCFAVIFVAFFCICFIIFYLFIRRSV